MENKTLWKDILTNSKKSFHARCDENNKPFYTAANFGMTKSQSCYIRREGEYTNFTVKIHETIKPLLTNIRVSKAVKFLQDNDVNSACKVLNIDDYVQKYGINILYYILKEWLTINNFIVPVEYTNNGNLIKDVDLKIINWIKTTRSDPIDAKIEIVNIGQSEKGQSVVPETWLGKMFNNANELHNAMNLLDWRRGKPPVNYCCVYSMCIIEEDGWKSIDVFKEILFTELKINFAIEILPEVKIKVIDDNNYLEWLNQLPPTCQIMKCTSKKNSKFLIACCLNQIDNVNNKTYEETENVGILVSRLQKSIRRGRQCSKLLVETIKSLWKARPYNLPEQQFAKVSSSKQLVWRLFISIVEDGELYIRDNNQHKILSLQELLCLAILCHYDPDIQFNQTIVDKIIYTALLNQYNDSPKKDWMWRKGDDKNVKLNLTNEINGTNGLINSFKVAILTLPMMQGDVIMLLKDISVIDKFKDQIKPLNEVNGVNGVNGVNMEELLKHHTDKLYKEAIYASYDMHCLPNILISLQSCLPFLPYNEKKHSTHGLSTFIWEKSSKFNVRYYNKIDVTPEEQLMLNELQFIQANINHTLPIKFNFEIFNKKESSKYVKNDYISELTKRLGFLLIFGQTYRLPSEGSKQKSIEVIIAGDKEKPCRIKRSSDKELKYLEGKDRFLEEKRFVQYINANDIVIDLPHPPEGYKWLIDTKKLKLNAIIKNSDENTFINTITFYVNSIEIESLNANKILEPVMKITTTTLPETFKVLIKNTIYIQNDPKEYINGTELNNTLREIWSYRNTHQNYTVYNWIDTCKEGKLPINLWKNIIMKINNNYDNEIQIGPVDRSGNKLHLSVDYLFEGVILRIFNMLSSIYPNVFKIKGQFKFVINKNVAEYNHLMECLKELTFNNNKIVKKTNIPLIMTSLWDHQTKTVDQIYNDIIKLNRKGFGDSSNVGAGKTLTALSVMCKLADYNFIENIQNYSGFLILLPTSKLYNTWKNEIKRHAINFHIVEQNADGTLYESSSDTIINELKFHSIVITTLGRIRDHPIINNWIYVVIDECLSVQNTDALWTMEAWKQIVSSQYGVLMLSATFFRSRFDKLFYMLKMLRSGLPEEKSYLDTIMSECMVCNVPLNTRKWTTNIHKYYLDHVQREKYDEIKQSDLASDMLYVKLNKFLYDNFDYVSCFRQIINKLTTDNRALIYARSKEEADKIASKLTTVSRYPDKSKKHVVLSYAEGTYGLNDLVLYDTLITRPCDPDKIPQMKGRLDRPGQQKEDLNIEYFIVDDTIEDALLLRLEMANNFHKNYIMPLAEFYDIAVGRKKKNTNNSINNGKSAKKIMKKKEW